MTIYDKRDSLRAGVKHQFVCQAEGSRPEATLTWWLDQSMKNFWRPDTDLRMVTSLWKIRSNITGGPYTTEGWTCEGGDQ